MSTPGVLHISQPVRRVEAGPLLARAPRRASDRFNGTSAKGGPDFTGSASLLLSTERD